MPCIELDLLIAFVNSADRLHEDTDALFLKVSRNEIKNVYVASSAYVEYELVHKAKGVEEEEVADDLEAFLNYPNLNEAPLKLETLIKAAELRKTYKLTYFDSLHAATAILNDGVITGTDQAYDSIPSLKRVSPQRI